MRTAVSLLKDLRMPDFREYGVDIPFPGDVEAQDMSVLGDFVRDIYKLNDKERNFRSFGPDETNSNRLNAVFEETDRVWNGEAYDTDDHLAPTAESWTPCSPSTCARVCSRATCSPAATASSTAMRRSSA